MNQRELAWAAGLFEGEGSFTTRNAGRPSAVAPTASLQMTDEDSVRRFHRAVGVGKVYGPYPGKEGRKPTWRWTTSTFESVQYVVGVLWFGLGERRRERAAELVRTTRRSGMFDQLRGIRRETCKRGHNDYRITSRGRRYCGRCNVMTPEERQVA